MGRQVRFYMLPEDERMFLQFVCREPTVVLLECISSKPELQVIANPLDSLQPTTKMKKILLWNTIFPIEQNDIQILRMRKYDEEQGVYVETGEVRYSIDVLNAHVIEYIPSFIRDDGQLVQGRIWAEMYRLENDKLVYKGTNFESWYDQVARWLRRNFKRAKDIDGYFGPQALEWYRGGGLLSR